MSQKSEETGARTAASSMEILEGRDFYWENGLMGMTAEFLEAPRLLLRVWVPALPVQSEVWQLI